MEIMRQKTFKLYEGSFSVYPVKEGEKYILIEKCKEGEVKGSFELREDNGGIGGNMNPEIKRYHGWRGTSYGIATYAHGLREVINVSDPMEDEDGYMYQKVTVGKDLKHEEE